MAKQRFKCLIVVLLCNSLIFSLLDVVQESHFDLLFLIAQGLIINMYFLIGFMLVYRKFKAYHEHTLAVYYGRLSDEERLGIK